VVEVTDAESFAAARRVTREEGLLIGGSGGTAVHAATVVGADLGPDDLVVAAAIVVAPETTAAVIAGAIEEAEARVRAAVPFRTVIYLEPRLADPAGA
jgi:hypothetical protein